MYASPCLFSPSLESLVLHVDFFLPLRSLPAVGLAQLHSIHHSKTQFLLYLQSNSSLPKLYPTLLTLHPHLLTVKSIVETASATSMRDDSSITQHTGTSIPAEAA